MQWIMYGYQKAERKSCRMKEEGGVKGHLAPPEGDNKKGICEIRRGELTSW